ncbi:MAG: DUF1588 domain-containing protein [Polyangiales bacterium]
MLWSIFLLLSICACQGAISDPGADLGGGPGDLPPHDPTQAGPALPSDQAPSTAVPRLSQREIEASVAEIFDIHGLAERILPGEATLATNPSTAGDEEVFDTFVGTLGAYIPGEVFVQAMATLAFDLAREVAADEDKVHALAGCEPSADDDALCMGQLIDNLGLRLFRRPLSGDERERLMASALDFALAETFYVGARVVIQSLVQSPDFIYRSDIGEDVGEGLRELDNYEMVSRLSYLFWGSPPSPMLLERAAGERFDEAEFAELVTMVADNPLTSIQARNLHVMWLGYEELLVTDETLRRDMLAESDALLERVLFDEGAAWSELFRSTESFLSPELAEHYGLASEGGWTEYEHPERAGILSHGSFLSLSSTRGHGTLPSRRGAMISARILCTPIPPPPADVNIDDGAIIEEGECKSDAYAAHRNAGSGCASCHSRMDPIGFGFERFDGHGRYRTVERENPECEIDGLGRAAGVDFTGPRQFVEAIAESGDLTECGTEQVLRFALRRGLAADDHKLVGRIHHGFVESGEDFRALMMGVALDPTFRYRMEESP